MKIPQEKDQRGRLLLLLRNIRQKKGLRQIDMAKQLGVPQSFVSKYESGERGLDILELRRICGIVGVSLTDFVQIWEESVDESE